MKYNAYAIRMSVAGLLVGMMSAVHATPTTYFAEDAPTGDFSNPIPDNSVAAAARSNFAQLLAPASIASDGFEAYGRNVQPINSPLSLFNGNGSLSMPSGSVRSFDRTETVVCDPMDPNNCPGRYNTTAGGTTWWQSADSFTVNYFAGFSAFGFYGTDFADFEGTLSIDLLDAQGTQVGDTLSVSASGKTGNGSLLFWGFTDDTTTYYGIRFNIGQTSTGNPDVLGFDDLIIGNLPRASVPEPTSLALVGLSLAGLALSRRRKLV